MTPRGWRLFPVTLPTVIITLLPFQQSESFLLPKPIPSHTVFSSPRQQQQQQQKLSSIAVGRISSTLYYSKPDSDSEKEWQQEVPPPPSSFSIDEQNRMELVRKLQQLYYQNETSGAVDHDHFGVYDNMPILRSTRVELPGFQSLWNITDPLEIHMFMKVIHDSKADKLFGHIHMADEYENIAIQGFTSYASPIVGEDGSGGGNEDKGEGEDAMSGEEAFRLQQERQRQHEFYTRDRYKIGTLMRVSDCHQDSNTGHLLVLVQALARFIVVEGSMERWDWLSLDYFHQPTKEEILLRSRGYKPTVQRASVELLPDEEFVQFFTQKAKETADAYDFSLNHDIRGAACAGAIAEASEWRFFETQPQRIPMPGHFLAPVASLSSRSATDVAEHVQATMEEYLSQPPIELHRGECSLYESYDEDSIEEHSTNFVSNDAEAASQAAQQHVLHIERSVWLELDKLVKNLAQMNPRANTQMPVPNQVLSLIPPGNMHWPEDFGLALYVRQLVRAHGVLARNKYKFSNGFQLVPRDYPPLRRARRLSYILWNVFLEQDTMDVPSAEMQRVLEIHSTARRLEAGLLQLQTINRILQTLIGN